MKPDPQTLRQIIEARIEVIKARRDERIMWIDMWRPEQGAQRVIDWASDVLKLDATLNELGYLLAQEATN